MQTSNVVNLRSASYAENFLQSYEKEMREGRTGRQILHINGFVTTVYPKNPVSTLYKKVTGDTNTESMKKALEVFQGVFPEVPQNKKALTLARKVALGMSHVIQDYYKGADPKDERLKKVIESSFEPFNRLFVSEASDDYSLKMKEGKLYFMLHTVPVVDLDNNHFVDSINAEFEVTVLDRGDFKAEDTIFSSIEEIASQFIPRELEA